MVRYRVQPKPLPKVRDFHLEGIFGEFEDVIDQAIAQNEALLEPIGKERACFFQFLKERVDPVQFGEMQEAQLADGKVRLDSDLVKYINPVTWFESKLTQALRLELNTRAPADILDLGTGPGHFPVVAQFYGHRVLGTDLPYRATGQLERGHLYDAMADIYQFRRIPLKIEQFVPLPQMERKFDLVTAFMAAFNVDAERRPWTIEAWKFFLNDLQANVLTNKGEIYMSLDDKKLTPEVWCFLSSHAVFTNDKAKQIHITDLSPFAS